MIPGSVTEGPMQDVVVPTEMPLQVHQEVVTAEMEKLTERLQSIPASGRSSVCGYISQIIDDEKKSPTKGKHKEVEFPVIAFEKSLWVNAGGNGDGEQLVPRGLRKSIGGSRASVARGGATGGGVFANTTESDFDHFEALEKNARGCFSLEFGPMVRFGVTFDPGFF
ncbi:hypothetical protein NQ318_019023 [Aromia moschata]|uniref:Uncharacterized protein n=1 Tax=Aromia moschata TaxID=1265417 RepID=A0AAV8Y1E4_9CUCU|nr:hypothetical protein NQ318_019023 [Aromia moschata]